MNSIVLAFITGLTTGGLSCLAVQGGLLASSIAHEVEQSVTSRPAASGRPRAGQTQRPPLRAARPIIVFLVAKVLAYTLLGVLLGLLGSVVQLSSIMRAVLQAAIGVFMVGTSLRMLNVHPIFRYFVFGPPSFVTRYIRRKAKGEFSSVTPLFLGALTILIPCGVTQAMLAVAMGTGNAVTGATIMLAFTLGTCPVFFTVAYMATRLGAMLEKGFMRLVAVIVLVLGLISIDTGLTLAGWPYSVTNLGTAMVGQQRDASPLAAAPQIQSVAPGAGTGQNPAPTPRPGSTDLTGALGRGAVASDTITITVSNNGYSPNLTRAKAGLPLRLALVTRNTNSCARAFVIPSLRVEKMLPSTGIVMLDIPAHSAGSRLFYSCSMGMYSGVIVFEG